MPYDLWIFLQVIAMVLWICKMLGINKMCFFFFNVDVNDANNG